MDLVAVFDPASIKKNSKKIKKNKNFTKLDHAVCLLSDL